jgi:Protein of unknown function (DUF1629)
MKRNYFVIAYAARSRPAGCKLVNGNEVFPKGVHVFFPPDLMERGFRDYPVKPKFLISTRLGRKMDDIERMHEHWLVSERAKKILADVGSDVRFLPVDVEIENNDQEQQPYWLCDVVTMLDAVDESRSNVKISTNDLGKRIHLIGLGQCLGINETVVGPRHVFRLTTSFPTIVCDETFKTAYKEGKLTGLSFRPSMKL